MAVIDVITFNGEYDLLEVRLSVLDDVVDQFIIVEATETFSGNPKPLYYIEGKDRYEKWWPKIKYYVVEPGDKEIEAMAEQSPNTTGADHWKREFYQKESIKKALIHLQDDDVVFIGDCDELWDTMLAKRTKDKVRKLKLRVYTYYLNNRSSEEFWGTIVGNYSDIKNECLNHLRTNASKTSMEHGWHFTSMGGVDELRRKLNDSYTYESYNTPWVQANLEGNVLWGKDFLGRDFKYWLDESEWPEYLKDNREKYARLCSQ